MSVTGQWLVETSPNSFDVVKAGRVKVEFGALVFYQDPFSPVFTSGAVVTILAPGSWLSVVPDEGDE